MKCPKLAMHVRKPSSIYSAGNRCLVNVSKSLKVLRIMSHRNIILFTSGILVTGFLFYTSVQKPGSDNVEVVLADSKNILYRLHRAERNWRQSVQKRHDYLKEMPTVDTYNPWGDRGFTVIWNLFAPTFDCPYMRERIGFVGDGGKWVCGLEHFEATQQPCIVYSFGVKTESSFEAEIVERTNCQIFAYDFSVDKMGPQIESSPRVHFQKVGLGGKTGGKYKTLQALMTENNHTWIDIFKADIEGGEFSGFNNIMNTFDVLPFGQLQLEIHFHATNFKNFYSWWERLEEKGLRPFSSEQNLVSCVQKTAKKPTFIEYSFLNVKANHTLVPVSLV